MNTRTITIYQAPGRRGKGSDAKGFIKSFTIEPGDVASLATAVAYDNCPAEYKDGHRHGDNFLYVNCILADIDNTHTDTATEWITPEHVKAAMPGVEFYYYPSRNHQKEKDGRSPRPKYHYIFPINPTDSILTYKTAMTCLIEYFPDLHFDNQVKSGGQLNYGVQGAQVSYVAGERNLSELLQAIDKGGIEPLTGTPPKSRKSIIPEGERNSTLSRRAGQLLKRYGDTDGQAYQAFLDEAAKCCPPLDDSELSTIWDSALSFYHKKVQADPEYIPPEKYHTNIWALPVTDPGAMAALCAGDPKARKFSIAAARLFLQAFGVTIKMNDMSKRVDIEGLPPEYSGEDSCNLLETLISDAANALAFKRASSPVIHEVLAVIASENHYHPVIELLTSGPWDKTDRLTELYRILGITDSFHKTLVRKWALQTVAVLYNTSDTPIAAQGVLVLQGAQGIGKTELFRHLAIYDRFFKGGATLDMLNKDSLMSAIKVWLCELGELDSTTKKEQSALKAFLTEQTDRFREPYARCETIRPRRTSFCGTVNPRGYLRDETGNRRYWTIPVEHIDIDAVFGYSPEWYTQFWRQIYAEYNRDPKSYLLTREEQDKVNGRNADFEADVYGEDEFLTAFDVNVAPYKWQWQTAAQIAGSLNERYKSLNIRSENIGGRLLPRIEKRIGTTFERKINRGRRLILCPPKLIQGYNDGDDTLFNPW